MPFRGEWVPPNHYVKLKEQSAPEPGTGWGKMFLVNIDATPKYLIYSQMRNKRACSSTVRAGDS